MKRWRHPCLSAFFMMMALVLHIAFLGRLNAEENRLLLAEGHASPKIIRVSDLPKRIGFKPGEISLIADPSDTYRDQLALYLVNDTDTPLPEAVGEGSRPITQIKVGGYWMRDHLDILDCACFGRSSDLPPHHALVIGTWNQISGETRCERRFFFQLKSRRITSQPISGTYRLQDLSEFLRYDERNELDRVAYENLSTGRWSENYCPGNVEEFVAIMELARNESQHLSLRSKVVEWLEAKNRNPRFTGDEARAVGPLLEILAKPWLNCLDRQSLAERARTALTAGTKGKFGSPESCRAAVWHYLSTTGLDKGSEYYASDSVPCNETTLSALVGLADRTMRESNDARELHYAGLFLVSSSVHPRHLGIQAVREYLSSGKLPLIHTALMIMAKRGASSDAGVWLTSHIKELGKDGAECYMEALYNNPSDNSLAEWELPVIEHLLESSPLETLARANGRLKLLPTENTSQKALPALRNFLKHELDPRRREWWTQVGKRTQVLPFDQDASDKVNGLTNGVCLLGKWGNSSDMALIRAYLDHPAASFSSAGRGFGKMIFGPRIAAKRNLESEKLPVPEGLITEKLVVIGQQKQEEGLFPWSTESRITFITVLLLAATVTGILWNHRIQRARR